MYKVVRKKTGGNTRVHPGASRRILVQDMELGTAIDDVRAAKKQAKNTVDASVRADAVLLSSSVDTELQRVIALASEKGASSWLTCRPLKRHGMTLTKGEFRDGIHLRYGWLPQRLPSSCSCGATFSVAHALSCPTGGFPSVRHNEVRDLNYAEASGSQCLRGAPPAAGHWGAVPVSHRYPD